MKINNDKTLVGFKRINQYAERVANSINEYYEQFSLSNVVAVGILSGAVPWMNLVLSKVTVPIEVEYIKASSYNGIFSKGKLKIENMPKNIKSGTQVILFDDIVDTAETMIKIKQLFEKKGAIVRTSALLKRESAEFHVDYIGRIVKDGLWLYGFGMDLQNSFGNQVYRNLPYVKILNKNK